MKKVFLKNSQESSRTIVLFLVKLKAEILKITLRVQMRSFFWYAFFRIWTEYRPEKTPYLDTFHSVIFFQNTSGRLLLKIYGDI